MKYVVLLVALTIGVFVMGDVTEAAGLVPCSGAPGDECQACKAVDLVNNVVAWLIGVLSIIIVLVIITAGLKLVTSGGSPSAKQSAKSLLTNAIIGYVIVLAAWLLVDYGMKALVSEDAATFGVWNQVQCVDQPRSLEFTGVQIARNNQTSCVAGAGGTLDCTAALASCAAIQGATSTVSEDGTTVNCSTPVATGGGSCGVIADTSNACHPSNLTCFSNAEAASQVCNIESGGGQAASLSGTDLCQDGSSFSVGLWQINILVNSQLIPGCATGIFERNTQGSCARRVTNSAGVSYCAMWDCRVANRSAYNACVAAAQNPANNTQAACSLYGTQGRGAWSTSVNRCQAGNM